MLSSTTLEHGNVGRKRVDVVRPAGQARAVAIDHAERPDGVEVVDVDVTDGALEGHDARLARLARRNGRAGCGKKLISNTDGELRELCV